MLVRAPTEWLSRVQEMNATAPTITAVESQRTGNPSKRGMTCVSKLRGCKVAGGNERDELAQCLAANGPVYNQAQWRRQDLARGGAQNDMDIA